MSDEKAVAWLRQVIEGDKVSATGFGDREVTARCEAELAILDEHYILTSDDKNPDYEEFCVYRFPSHGYDFGCVCCHYYAQGAVRNYGYCRTLAAVASAYRHREGYTEHWAVPTR
jgi:hypothetical protein